MKRNGFKFAGATCLNHKIFDPLDSEKSGVSTSAFHRELLSSHLCLMKSSEDYKQKQFISSLMSSDDRSSPLALNTIKKTKRAFGYELFSMLRSHMDVRVEYSTREELARAREAYLVHIVDSVA